MVVNSEIKLLCDEHVPFGLISALRNHGVDARSVQELSLSGADDDIIYDFAVSKGYIIITGNIKDFSRLLQTRSNLCSIIFLQLARKGRNIRFGEIAREIIEKIYYYINNSQQFFIDYVDP